MPKRKSQTEPTVMSRGKVVQILPCPVQLYAAFAQKGTDSEAVFSQVLALAHVDYDANANARLVPLCVDLRTRDSVVVASEMNYFDAAGQPSCELQYLGLSSVEGRHLFGPKVTEANRPFYEPRVLRAWNRRFGDDGPFHKPKYSSLTFRPFASTTTTDLGRGGPSLQLLQQVDCDRRS